MLNPEAREAAIQRLCDQIPEDWLMPVLTIMRSLREAPSVAYVAPPPTAGELARQAALEAELGRIAEEYGE